MNTPVADLVREQLSILADAIDSKPPPLEQLLARSEASGHGRSRWGRRAALAVGVAAGLGLGGVAVAATEVIPAGVAELLRNKGSELSSLPEQASLFATYSEEDGTNYEVWAAPTRDGGLCLAMVVAGRTEGDGLTCGLPWTLQGDGTLRALVFSTTDGRRAVFGAAPPEFAEVRAAFDDGTDLVAPVSDGRFFVVSEREVCAPRHDCAPAVVSGIDAAGEVIWRGNG